MHELHSEGGTKTNMHAKTGKGLGRLRIAVHGVMLPLVVISCVILINTIITADDAPAHPGYYRDPAIHGDTIIFTAEGDLWTVSVKGGAARRLDLQSGPGRWRGHFSGRPDRCLQRRIRGPDGGLHDAGGGRLAPAPHLGR